MRSEPVDRSAPSIRAPCPTTDRSSPRCSATILLSLRDGRLLLVDATEHLRASAALLRGDPSLHRPLARLRGTALHGGRRDRLREDVSEPLPGDLAVAELRPLLLRRDGEHPVDEPIREPLERPRPLRRTERRRRREIETELHP